jgi:hypothetical protein
MSRGLGWEYDIGFSSLLFLSSLPLELAILGSNAGEASVPMVPLLAGIGVGNGCACKYASDIQAIRKRAKVVRASKSIHAGSAANDDQIKPGSHAIIENPPRSRLRSGAYDEFIDYIEFNI